VTTVAKDLGSILSFLQVCRPLDNEDFFKRLVLRPLKDGDPEGVEILRVCSDKAKSCKILNIFAQALMSQICIRRTKEVSEILSRSCLSLTLTPDSRCRTAREITLLLCRR
jgi:SWI/SNF-related matrix-associated actin-dependent regulator of chromatin subfamily A3